jgi:hypothetical protein
MMNMRNLLLGSLIVVIISFITLFVGYSTLAAIILGAAGPYFSIAVAETIGGHYDREKECQKDNP